ncbi:protein SapB [Alicyclobacillus cellulosilyticus]|uniref:Protein SapB n=1 Tax=Alicyclobacillus cellulosilyticus TaxID=1003997 RepID=A0A917K5W0_9BACL|nr:MgtC/SapB family protein [Alicyclobacillus cellulosilyticus]GGI99090.1 protein SapB [Alicyclobacillus cellulosilyticus]
MYHHDILKLVVSAALGMLLGLEREMKRKPLGLRTCLVISIASCLLTIVSVDASLVPAGAGTNVIRTDPMRLAAQIVSGIGFLGAGVIMRRSNEVISGLTTAAMVWASAGIGIAVGAGFYAQALFGVVLLLISVELVPWVLQRRGPHVLREKEVTMTIRLAEGVRASDVLGQLPVLECRVERVRNTPSGDKVFREFTVVCLVERRAAVTDLFDAVAHLPGVVSVDVLGS